MGILLIKCGDNDDRMWGIVGKMWGNCGFSPHILSGPHFLKSTPIEIQVHVVYGYVPSHQTSNISIPRWYYNRTSSFHFQHECMASYFILFRDFGKGSAYDDITLTAAPFSEQAPTCLVHLQYLASVHRLISDLHAIKYVWINSGFVNFSRPF